MDRLLTAPSPEPAGLLASKLALACDSGEVLLVLLVLGEGDALLFEGVVGAGVLGGLVLTWAIIASLNRHFTSSACHERERCVRKVIHGNRNWHYLDGKLRDISANLYNEENHLRQKKEVPGYQFSKKENTHSRKSKTQNTLNHEQRRLSLRRILWTENDNLALLKIFDTPTVVPKYSNNNNKNKNRELSESVASWRVRFKTRPVAERDILQSSF